MTDEKIINAYIVLNMQFVAMNLKNQRINAIFIV